MRSRLVTTLLSLTLLTGGASMGLGLYGARQEAEQLSQALMEQSGARTQAELGRFFGAPRNLLAVSGEWARAGLLDIDDPAALNARFVPLLRRSTAITSMLVATAEGDEYMLLLHDDGSYENRLVRLTDPEMGTTHQRRIQYDQAGEALSDELETRPYDPRERPWFRGAISRTGVPHWTDPYLFRTTQEPGITTSQVNQTPRGPLVLAFDIKLLDLSLFTSSLRLRERGWVAVLSGRRVVGLPGPQTEPTIREIFGHGVPSVEALPVPGLVELADVVPGEETHVAVGDQSFVGLTREFELGPQSSLRILSTLDEAAVFAGVRRQRNWLLSLMLVALGLAFAVSLMLARSVARLRPTDTYEGKQVGQYQLEGRLGEGGMGTVYRASHSMLRRPTAVKLLREDRRRAKDLARFEREVQLTSQLTHPNTIAIYDYGLTPEGAFYYAMEYVEGVTLQSLVNAVGPLPPARVIHIMRQVLGSLAEAHDVGLIHRDIKPANIMLCERGGVSDVVKVLDFGLVKRLAPRESEKDLSGTDNFAGTPLYLAPESVTHPKEMDARSDLYSVAAVGYFLLTGTPVFQGKTAVDTITQHLKSQPQLPSERLGRPVAADFERVLLVGLAKDKHDRPEDAREFERMLDTCADAYQWRAEDSRTWWRTHGEAVREVARHDTALESRPESEKPAAMGVDMSRRTTLRAPDDE